MMGTMDYYRRLNADGSCESICTRCFETLGRANETAQIKLLEATHTCAVRPDSLELKTSNRNRRRKSIAPFLAIAQPRRFLGKRSAANTILSLFSIVVGLYILPTVIELELITHTSVWVSCILFGNLIGCAFLSLGLGLRKTGVLLYGFLTVSEAWLYTAHILSPHVLVWFVDSSPTLTAMSLVAFFSFTSDERTTETIK
jgi:hypothetical protein